MDFKISLREVIEVAQFTRCVDIRQRSRDNESIQKFAPSDNCAQSS